MSKDLKRTRNIFHIAIADKAVMDDSDEPKMIIRGLTYSPADVFSKLNDISEELYAKFFKQGESYRLVCLQTDMRLGAFFGFFMEKLRLEHNGLWVGQIIIPFKLCVEQLDEFWRTVAECTSDAKPGKVSV